MLRPSGPAGADLIVRAAQDRATEARRRGRPDDASLFASAAAWPELTQMLVKVAPRRVGDPGRIATVALRAGPVTSSGRATGSAKTDPETVSMTLVEAREINPPANQEPLRWRLLTSIEVGDADAACEIVRLYRLRWRIDIDQAWRLSRIKGWVGSTCTEAFWVEHQSRPNPRGRSASDSWLTRSRHSSMASRRSASALSARLAGRLSRHS